MSGCYAQFLRLSFLLISLTSLEHSHVPRTILNFLYGSPDFISIEQDEATTIRSHNEQRRNLHLIEVKRLAQDHPSKNQQGWDSRCSRLTPALGSVVHTQGQSLPSSPSPLLREPVPGVWGVSVSPYSPPAGRS